MLGAALSAGEYFTRLQAEIAAVDQQAVERWADAVYQAWEDGRWVFIVGNGGSGSTASHMAEDLGKSTLDDADLADESRKRLKVLSLTDNTGWIMAIGNDLHYDQIFVQQLMNYGSAGDLLIAISGSGNSQNVLNAASWSARNGVKVFGLTGYSGGKLKQQQDDGIHVAIDDIGMVEGIHLCLFHWMLNDVYARINKTGRYA